MIWCNEKKIYQSQKWPWRWDMEMFHSMRHVHHIYTSFTRNATGITRWTPSHPMYENSAFCTKLFVHQANVAGALIVHQEYATGAFIIHQVNIVEHFGSYIKRNGIYPRWACIRELDHSRPTECAYRFVTLCSALIKSNFQPLNQFPLKLYALFDGVTWPVTGEFPAQKASNVENASIWWRHHIFSIDQLQWQRALVQFTEAWYIWRGYLTNWLRPNDTNWCHKYLDKISSRNGLSPIRSQDIIWTNGDKMSIGPFGDKLQWSLKQYVLTFIHDIVFENIIYEILTILFWPLR